MKTVNITKKQSEILLLLFKFRFLNTIQIQALLNHSNSNRIQAWLKDLLEKGCVKRHYERKSFSENNKPAIYYLGPKSRHIIKNLIDIDLTQLDYIYQESRRDKKFIAHCIFIADTYLYLRSQKNEKEELKFFTKADLRGYAYFPDPMPDAFISRKGDNSKNYFLDIFDEYSPLFVLRNRVKKYIEYAENPEWEENTANTPLPVILFICPTDSSLKHIKHYATALLEKSFDKRIELFLITKSQISLTSSNSIWEKAG